MDFIGILKCLGLVVIIVLLLIGVINIFSRIKMTEDMDRSFKQIVKYLLISALISDIMGLLNLLLATTSGGWPLGFGACEIWGFASTTLLAFTAWMITLTVIERYLAIMSPSELTAAFSDRNTRIMTIGMLFLVMMAVTGPFYGFGEYTYLRGYLNVFVSSNISLPLPESKNDHMEVEKLQNLHELFSHLRHSSYSSPKTDMLALISRHIHQHFDVIVSKAEWLAHGILFSIRAKSKPSLEAFVEHLNDKLFTQNITDLSFIDDIANSLNISDTELTAHMEMSDYRNYIKKHLTIQEMGVCTADITSPSHHVSIWTGFYVSTVFILPYCLSLGGLCVLYIRGFGYNSYASKRASDLDVSHTNITSTICMLNCALNLVNFLTLLSCKNETLICPDIYFIVSVIISLKSLPIVLTMRLGPTLCNCYCACCNECVSKVLHWRSVDNMSYELSDIEIRQSLTGKKMNDKISNVSF